MRILVLSNEYPPHIYGGAGVHVDHLCRELMRIGGDAHRLQVLCFGDQRETGSNVEVRGIAGLPMLPCLDGGNRKVIDVPKGPLSDDILEIARATDEALGLGLDILLGELTVFDEYIGVGYGVVDKAVAETIRLVFQTEGIVLDPIYKAKAMIGLRDLIKTGFFNPTDKVVFLHTGGTPALFPNRDKIFNFLVKKP